MLSHKDIKIIKNQCKETLQLIEFLEEKTGQIHLEKEIKFYFKERKYLGSRDRRFINNHVYAYYRWKGWLQRFRSIEMLCIASLLDQCVTEKSFQYFAEHKSVQLSEAEANQILKGDLSRKCELLNKLYSFHLEIIDLIPDWMHDKIDRTELENYIDANTKRANVWIRLQRSNLAQFLKMNPQESYTHFELLPKAVGLPANTSIEDSASYQKGFFEIQDVGSQTITVICNAKKGETWWDACAGAGGKSLALSDSNATVSASDIRVYKLRELQRRAKKGRQSIKSFEFNVADKVNPTHYDGVLVDAPCSCSGTWRRRPSDRWKTTPTELDELNTLQRNILSNAAKSVKQGGVLIYATCSVFKDENENIITYFLEHYPDFHLEPFVNPINGINTKGTLQLWPHIHNSDGMYIAKLRRAKTPK